MMVSRPILTVLAIAALTATVMVSTENREASSQPGRRVLTGALFGDEAAVANSNEVKAWRLGIMEGCMSAQNEQDSIILKERMISGFKPSRIRDGTHEDRLPVESCPYVFLDFGANVGDSAGHFIEAGLPGCKKYNVPDPSFNLLTGQVGVNVRQKPQLSYWVQERIQEFQGANLGPEDYCVFGIEGNPVFTSKLHQLERHIMRTTPRPVRRLHFFTETVAAAKDGPTTLFLDTVNEGQNFWGSSLLSTHVDVQRTAKKEGSVVPAPVHGISLSTILKRTLGAYTNGHVMLKMDIEGGEFQVLNEVADSGTLCGYAQKHNMKVDIIVEYHKGQFIGENNDMDRYFKESKNKLLSCNINLYEMGMNWGRRA